MQVYLPFPYPGELLNSVITRFMVRTGSTKISTLTKLLFKVRLKNLQVEMPNHLTALSEITASSWSLTDEEIAETLTLYPLYSCYASEKTASLCLHQLKTGGHGPSLLRLGMIGKRAKVPRYLRYCRSCRDSDISLHGETYWHRCHQIPGVLVCPDHGEWLRDSTVMMRGNNCNQDATSATTAPTEDRKALCDIVGRDVAEKYMKVVARCKEMLKGCPVSWPKQDYPITYRRAALQRGFVKDHSRLKYTELEKAFLRFYSAQLLSLIGCELRQGKTWNWLENIFKVSYETHYPIEHALVQVFLESVPVDSSKNNFGFGPWKCPNPYAAHESTYPIKKIRIKKYADGKIIGSARCSCGFCFSFSSMNHDDPDLPIVNRVSIYGESWTKEANRLKSQGLSRSKIGESLGVCDFTTKRILDNTHKRKQTAAELVNLRRKEWREIRKVSAGLQQIFKNKRSRNIYIWLSRHDPKWPYKEPRKKISKPHRPSPVNWQVRDNQWAESLRAAASRIKTKVPIKRASKTAIIKAAGLQSIVLEKYSRLLPLSWQTITQEMESTEDFNNIRKSEMCRKSTAA